MDDYCKVERVKSEPPYNKVSRCYEAKEDDRLHGKRTLPVTEADRPDIIIAKEVWKDVDPRECIEREGNRCWYWGGQVDGNRHSLAIWSNDWRRTTKRRSFAQLRRTWQQVAYDTT